jgi:hypothetical protein
LAIGSNNVAAGKHSRRLLHFKPEPWRVICVHVPVVPAGREFQFHPGGMQRK